MKLQYSPIYSGHTSILHYEVSKEDAANFIPLTESLTCHIAELDLDVQLYERAHK